MAASAHGGAKSDDDDDDRAPLRLRTLSDHVGDGCGAAGVLRTSAVRRVQLQRDLIDMEISQSYGWTPEGYAAQEGRRSRGGGVALGLSLVRLLWPQLGLAGKMRLKSLRRQRAFYEAVPASVEETPWLLTLASDDATLTACVVPAAGGALVQRVAPSGVVGLAFYRDGVPVERLPD
jgi:hypothetical protein